MASHSAARFSTITALCALIATACSSSPATTAPSLAPASSSSTSFSAPDARSAASILDEIDATANEQGFTCGIGDIVVSFAPSKNAVGYDSVYASYLKPGSGLEIVTLNGVSYARWLGAPPRDVSATRSAVLQRLDGAWGTWGQPDTITLESLPPSPTKCLEWAGNTQFSKATREADGSWHLEGTATSDEGITQVAGHATTDSDGAFSSFSLKTEESITPTINVTLADTHPLIQSAATSDPRQPRGRVVTLTQDEYFALVGG